MRPEGIVTFEHDPTNEYDPNAIKVLYGNVWIGFVKADSYAQEFLKDHPNITEGNVTGYCYAEGKGNDLTFNNDHKGRLSSVGFEIVSGEDNIVMDEDNNYLINEKRYMRLSNVIKHFDPEPDSPGLDRWKIDHEDYEAYRKDLNDRARAGTAMHHAIESYIKTGQTDILIPDGFWNFVKKHEVEFLTTETLMWNDETGIAGTGDAGASVMDGPKKARVQKKVWIDWKSSKKPTKKHGIQNSWYTVEQGYDEAWVVAFGAETKQGYSLMKIPNEKAKRLHALVGLIKQGIELLRG
jgi:hypothetical protein